MVKRVRALTAKSGQLRAGWGRPDPGDAPDLVYVCGGDGAAKSDARILFYAIENSDVMDGRSLREELERRGYDIKTLKFSIEQKEGG